MSHPESNTALSRSPLTALLSPLAFGSPAWLLQKWREFNEIDSTRRGDLNSMIRIYAATCTIGGTAVALIRVATYFAAITMVIGSHQLRREFWDEFRRTTAAGLTADKLERRAELAFSWQNWVFNRVYAFTRICH
ncbi:hypothetical protein MMC19_004564 [Ptychographa xylographoides]|nr:hypothetical protein [Ptychographa xylographoides]